MASNKANRMGRPEAPTKRPHNGRVSAGPNIPGPVTEAESLTTISLFSFSSRHLWTQLELQSSDLMPWVLRKEILYRMTSEQTTTHAAFPLKWYSRQAVYRLCAKSLQIKLWGPDERSNRSISLVFYKSDRLRSYTIHFVQEAAHPGTPCRPRA